MGSFLDQSDSYFLFGDLVGFYTHWTYMHIFRHIFLSNYWWQRSDIWSQASYRYPISWEAFLDPSDSYFLFAKERGYHRWALAHSSSCLDIVKHVLVINMHEIFSAGSLTTNIQSINQHHYCFPAPAWLPRTPSFQSLRLKISLIPLLFQKNLSEKIYCFNQTKFH